jgi:hypothetical protein
MNRENVIFVLQIIALKSEQIDLFKESEGLIHLHEHLLKQWEDAYKPEREGFIREFSEDELTQMKSFTEFYLNRVENLPNQFSELLKDPYWNAVCEYAGEILTDFQNNGGSPPTNPNHLI